MLSFTARQSTPVDARRLFCSSFIHTPTHFQRLPPRLTRTPPRAPTSACLCFLKHRSTLQQIARSILPPHLQDLPTTASQYRTGSQRQPRSAFRISPLVAVLPPRWQYQPPQMQHTPPFSAGHMLISASTVSAHLPLSFLKQDPPYSTSTRSNLSTTTSQDQDHLGSQR